MTIVPIHILEPDDLPYLGDNLSEAIRLDHEDLEAGNKDLYYQEEPPAETELNPED